MLSHYNDQITCILNDLYRKLGDKLGPMLQGEGVASFPANTLFEVSTVNRRSGEHGEYGELTYMTTLEGKRKGGKVRVPGSALANLQRDGPCLLFYAGTRQTAKGRTCYDISVMRAPDGTPAGGLKSMADKLRAMGAVGIKAAMSGVPLDNFEANTLFIFCNPRLQSMGKDRNDLLIVDFETGEGEQRVVGKLLLPARLEQDTKECGSGILFYGGQRKSQEGRMYHDVSVISSSTADCLTEVTTDNA